mmetsp:Transcript_19615/g.55364  ORF Transcript_19615/g.55364 Transcript_19615/m.55364 type:complete len:307 (-) Transcript_19615:40-960(-)
MAKSKHDGDSSSSEDEADKIARYREMRRASDVFETINNESLRSLGGDGSDHNTASNNNSNSSLGGTGSYHKRTKPKKRPPSTPSERPGDWLGTPTGGRQKPTYKIKKVISAPTMDDDDDDDDSGEYLQQLNDTPSGHGNSPPTRYARTAKTRNSTTSSSSSSKSAHGPRMVDDANTSRTTRSVTSVRSAPHMASTNSDNNNNHKQRDSKASPSSIPKSVRIVDKSNPIYKLQKQRRKTVVRGVVGGAVAGVVLGPIGIVGGAVAGGMVASSYAKQRERKDYRKMEKQVLQGMALDDERLVRQGYYV